MIELTALDASHLYAAFGWRNNPAIWRWCRQSGPLSWDNHTGWFNSLKNNDAIRMFAVLYGEIVGVCGLTSIDWVNRRAEFSLYIGSEHQRNGYAKAALTALFDHGFKNLNLDLIWGESFDGNPAMAMFDKMGMTRDGIRRQFYYRDGKYIDAHLFSITAEEWKARP